MLLVSESKLGEVVAIKKKYEDSVLIGGFPEDNLAKAIASLEKAGFKKVRHEKPMLRVRGDWKPLIGTLYGDITLDFNGEGQNTKVDITIVAAVDNAYALVNSPGERLKSKFLDEFSQVTSAPGPQEAEDIATKLAKLDGLWERGLITNDEYEKARVNIISGI